MGSGPTIEMIGQAGLIEQAPTVILHIISAWLNFYKKLKR